MQRIIFEHVGRSFIMFEFKSKDYPPPPISNHEMRSLVLNSKNGDVTVNFDLKIPYIKCIIFFQFRFLPFSLNNVLTGIPVHIPRTAVSRNRIKQ